MREIVEPNKHLFNKNAVSIIGLSKEFIKAPRGEKIPTVTDFCDSLDVARGTIQNSLKTLQQEGAIVLESRGHLGTFLLDKDMKKLTDFACIYSIVGCMPLPYSKKYEGFASGLIVAMENQYNLLASMAYMRGAKNRIAMVIADRYDFAIVSKYAALRSLTENQEIEIIKSFGPYSYVSEHVIVMHDKDAKEIQDGMKVGIDQYSIDQKRLTELACAGKNVEYVPMDDSKILQRVIDGTIDAAVWNKDEITDNFFEVNFKPIVVSEMSDTEAVMIVHSTRPEMTALLDQIIDTQVVLTTQKMVLDGKITPSY